MGTSPAGPDERVGLLFAGGSALLRGMSTAPADDSTDADRRVIDLAGLRLPLRASVALAVVSVAILLDHSRTFIPTAVVELGRTPDVMRVTAIERAILFGLMPLLVVLLAFRDRPTRYGLAVGDWRTGLPLTLVGCALMTPLVVWFAGLPGVGDYYAPSAEPLPGLLLTNTIDLTAAEFLFRGFLTLTLVRAIGPFGVLVATLPFIFAHIGKPELELFSTLAGGPIYGWLAWRTRSIVWGTVGHVYILSLVTMAAAASP